MKNVFLVTQNVSRFREAMSVLEDVEMGQPGLAVVWGRAGRGKTECSREYAMRTGAVYLRVMEGWTPRGMLAALCKEISGTEPRTADHCKRLLIDELERFRRLILVDEADRLRRVEMIEHLRDVHDLTGAPIVLIGEEHLHSMISGRRRLWSRVTQAVGFGPIETEDIILFGGKAAGLKIQPDAATEVGKRSGGDFRLIYLDVRDLERMGRTNRTDVATKDMVRALPHRKPGPSMARRGR